MDEVIYADEPNLINRRIVRVERDYHQNGGVCSCAQHCGDVVACEYGMMRHFVDNQGHFG